MTLYATSKMLLLYYVMAPSVERMVSPWLLRL